MDALGPFGANPRRPWLKSNGIPFRGFRRTTHVSFFGGDWDVHSGDDLDLDPWPIWAQAPPPPRPVEYNPTPGSRIFRSTA